MARKIDTENKEVGAEQSKRRSRAWAESTGAGTRAQSVHRLQRLAKSQADDTYPTKTGSVKFETGKYGKGTTGVPHKVKPGRKPPAPGAADIAFPTAFKRKGVPTMMKSSAKKIQMKKIKPLPIKPRKPLKKKI